MGVIIIGIADLNIARSPDVLATLGLGSCVGVTMYDKTCSLAGMAHIMLPDSSGYASHKREKFADTAIADLLALMLRAGAQRGAIVAKLAGGAHMFGGSTSDILKVGERNSAACAEMLRQLRIPVVASDTGGQYGRTIELYAENGALKIKAVGRGEKFI